MDLEYSWFKRKIKELTGLDLEHYRPEQMRRLADKMIDQSGARNYVDFINRLKSDPSLVAGVRDSLTINVSHLFRDPDKWNTLRELLPELITSAATGHHPREFRAWSAGCSIGAEPYTLAILLQELLAESKLPPFKYSILCTDIDTGMLARAKDGIFADRDVQLVQPPLLEKHFRRIDKPDRDWARGAPNAAYHEATPELRAAMRFKIHNMLNDRFDRDFDLIMCRNVLIYFNREAKERLFNGFSDSLAPHGLLFIGGTEIVFTPWEFGLKNMSMCFYRKAERRSTPPTHKKPAEPHGETEPPPDTKGAESHG